MHRSSTSWPPACARLVDGWPGLFMAIGLFALASMAQGPLVDLTTIDGRQASGSVTVADGLVSLTQEDGAAFELPLGDVLAMACSGGASMSEPGDLLVWLRSGSVIPARKIDGTAGGSGKTPMLSLDTAAGARIEVPLSSVAAIRSRSAEPGTFRADLEEPALNLDYLFIVKEGVPQKFSVTVESIHDGRVHFDLRGASYDFSLVGEDSVAGIVFGKNTGFAPDRQRRPRVLATMRSGERLEGKLKKLDSTLCLLLDEGVDFEAPSAGLLRLDVLSDKLTWLGSLQPKVEQTAAFDRVWPWTVDRSPAGEGIVLGGKVYSRGVVLVPRTRLIYDVGGRYDVFEAVIGIDDRGGPQAHAIFRVLGDGKLLFESVPRIFGQQPSPIRIELNRCRLLAIEADFGKNFDLGDLCAFADARIVQQ